MNIESPRKKKSIINEIILERVEKNLSIVENNLVCKEKCLNFERNEFNFDGTSHEIIVPNRDTTTNLGLIIL